MKVSIKKISEITGFSQATVSNALNNKQGVNKNTAEQIWEVARKYGYFSESKIESIRFVIYKDSGQIVSDTPFFSQLIEGIEEETRRSGREIIISNLNRSAPDYEQARDRILLDSSSGIIVLATELSEEDAGAFAGAVNPVVMLDNCFDSPAYNSVMIGNTDAVCMAVESMIEKGHKEIGYLKSTIRIKNFFYRESGYRRALRLNGLIPDQKYEFGLAPTTEGAYQDMNRLLEGHPEMPTAFFADNDIIAMGAMKALQEHGFRIPDDISIVGFDDLPFCSVTIPSLSTIKVFKQEMGRAAVRRLNELIQYGDQFKTKTQICCEFIERESVKKIS